MLYARRHPAECTHARGSRNHVLCLAFLCQDLSTALSFANPPLLCCPRAVSARVILLRLHPSCTRPAAAHREETTWNSSYAPAWELTCSCMRHGFFHPRRFSFKYTQLGIDNTLWTLTSMRRHGVCPHPCATPQISPTTSFTPVVRSSADICP